MYLPKGTHTGDMSRGIACPPALLVCLMQRDARVRVLEYGCCERCGSRRENARQKCARRASGKGNEGGYEERSFQWSARRTPRPGRPRQRSDEFLRMMQAQLVSLIVGWGT